MKLQDLPKVFQSMGRPSEGLSGNNIEAVQKDWIAMLSAAKHLIFREIKQILQSLRSFRMAFTFFLDNLVRAYFTLTSICFGFASSAFGRVTVKMPSLYMASMLSPFTVVGSLKDRWNEPYVRSTR